MHNKFIRVIPPISALVVIFFDAAALILGYLAVKKITEDVSFYTVSFVVIEAIVIFVAILTSIEILRNGVKFDNSQIEFTGLDENNIFEYSNIEKLEAHKDTKISLRKNFVDRYSSLILYLKDGSVATIELGLTTKRKLKKIEDEINNRITTH